MTVEEGGRVSAGTRLVHIGPHKTGTTALQAALWNSRPALLEQGVRHVGRSRNPSSAARAVVGQPSTYSADKPPSMRDWHSLVGEFRRASEARAVVSSEFLAWAKPGAIHRIVSELEPGRIHVAITLRSLARVIPSTWQQNVQNGSDEAFDHWLRRVIDGVNRPFWFLERHDELIERWAAIAGVDHVTAVVVDDRDHAVLLHAFEALLGVGAGTLVDIPDEMNRSLTWPEAEAVRAFNVAFGAEDLPRELHARAMRLGAAQHMKRRVPPPDERRVTLPDWAVEPLAAIQERVVEGIRASGVRVVGDLGVLTSPVEAEPRGEAAGDPETAIPADVAATLAMGLLDATGAVRTAAISKGPFKFAEPAEVARVPTYQLVGAIAGRGWRATIGRLPFPGRRRPSA